MNDNSIWDEITILPLKNKNKKIVKEKEPINCEDISNKAKDLFDDDIDIIGPMQNINHLKVNIPWTEKYRPREITDITANEHILKKINEIIKNKEMPNIIIGGLSGIGKTSTILYIAKKLYGKYYKDAVLELNASDDRGIKSVQDPIVYFCKKKLHMAPENGITYPKHKIIILDEADNMTKKAQQRLNNLISEYYDTTRFAFTCNNSVDIIEAIQSRCLIFKYNKLSNGQIIDRLMFICNKENVKFDSDGLKMVATVSDGDMRKAVNLINIINNAYGEINIENANNICDVPDPVIISDMIFACKNKDIKTALLKFEILLNSGCCFSNIGHGMFNMLQQTNLIDMNTKIKYLNEISETLFTINKGISTKLQISGCLAALCKID